MFFMFRVSVEMMALMFLSWELWLGLFLLAVGAAIARRRPVAPEPSAGARRIYSAGIGIASFLALPLLMLAWGLYFWPAEGRSAHEQLALRGLYVLALAQLVLCLALTWHHRGRLRVTVSAAAALWWAAGALATASMAVTNTWL